MAPLEGFSDEDLRQTMMRAMRLLVIATVVLVPLVWWKEDWQSAALVVVGAAISGTGLWEWMHLMTAVMARMDAGAKPRPMGLVLTGFFLRLGLALVVLYVSLKFLDGSVYALAGGLVLGIFALCVEALKLVRSWTV
jgi:hypothetical protein